MSSNECLCILAPFGKDDDIMQEKVSIKEWQKEYLAELRLSKLPISDYELMLMMQSGLMLML